MAGHRTYSRYYGAKTSYRKAGSNYLDLQKRQLEFFCIDLPLLVIDVIVLVYNFFVTGGNNNGGGRRRRRARD